MQVTIYIAAGAMAALIGLIALYVTGGGLDFEALRAHAIPIAAQVWIYGALLVGFGIWSSMWPFHTWSPLTYAAAPAPAAMIFAGVMKNFGAYALLRIGLEILPDGAHAWAKTLAAIGTVNILYGGWAAMRQKDWNFIIAYSSISHIGYLLLAIAVGGPIGTSAAVLFMVAHGLVVAMLFAISGLLEQGAGSRHVPELGGLARALPFVSVAMAVAVIAASGLPGFGNFVAEVLVFVSAWTAGGWIFRAGAVAAVWGIVITATYFFRALRSTFYGEPRNVPAAAVKPPVATILALALLLILSVSIGVWPRLIVDAARLSVTKAADATTSLMAKLP